MSLKLEHIFDNLLVLLRIVDYESRLVEGVFVMSVEPIKEVIRLWRRFIFNMPISWLNLGTVVHSAQNYPTEDNHR